MTIDSVPFAKLEGLGNDFVLIDHRESALEITPELARALGDRRRGVGCDQILVIETPESAGALCAYRIFNADGTPAEQCGNGVRCIGLWLHLRGEFDDHALLDSPAGPVTVRPLGDGRFEATLSAPEFNPEAVGTGLHGAPPWRLEVDGGEVECYGASMGNPHLLILGDHPAETLATLGESLNRHPAFPEGVNVGLGRIEDEHTLHLRVFERGAGPTPACGSGASACAAMLVNAGKLQNPVTVIQPGGPLMIEWPGAGFAARMSGPARMVFRGQFEWNTAAQ